MSKTKYSAADLDARLKFFLGITLGLILFFTAMGILYALIFVTQPVNAQSENDKMFFNVLGSIATFITGTLAGILIGSKGGDSESASAEPMFPVATTEEVVDDASEAAEAVVEEVPAGKPAGQMPDEQPVEEDWDKD